RAGFDSGRGDCGDRNGMARAYAPVSLLFYFCQLYRASSCWYSCWYRQQSTKKITLHSNGYGGGRVSARGTRLKTSIITITYGISSISDFQEHFRGTLKTHVKVRSSRPCCWHFCWYRGNERSQRISLF